MPIRFINDRVMVEPRKVFRSFANATNKNFKKYLFTQESVYSVSGIGIARQIKLIIQNHMSDTLNKTITDATANIGSDTAYMARYFKHVNAIEYNYNNYVALKNNIRIENLHNVTCIHGDSVELLKHTVQDVIYMDPPWGGVDYKKNNELDLFMSGQEITSLYETFRDRAELFLFKVPINYKFSNFDKFKDVIKVYPLYGDVQTDRIILYIIIAEGSKDKT